MRATAAYAPTSSRSTSSSTDAGRPGGRIRRAIASPRGASHDRAPGGGSRGARGRRLTIAWRCSPARRRWPVDARARAASSPRGARGGGSAVRGARRTVALGLAGDRSASLIEIAGRAAADARRPDRRASSLLALGGSVCRSASGAFWPRADPPSTPVPRPVHQPALRRRQGGALRLAGDARERGIESSSSGPATTSTSSSRTRSAAGADALAMAGGDGSQAIVARSPPSTTCPTPASRPGRATTSPSTSASTATTSSARSTRFVDGGERASTSPRSTAASSSTTSRSGSTPRRSSARATARPRCARCSTPCPTWSARDGAGPRPATGPGRAAHEHHSGAVILVSNNRYRLGGRSARARARASTTACSASRSSARRAARGGGAGSQRPWREWATPEFEVGSAEPVPAGIDGEAATLDAAAALPDPPRRPARADRAQPPRRLAVGRASGGLSARERWACSGSRSAGIPPDALRTPLRRNARAEFVQRSTKGRVGTIDGDFRDRDAEGDRRWSPRR